MTTFINSFRSEWLKKKRSLASWLVIVGAFFTPVIILLVRIKRSSGLFAGNAMPEFWDHLWQMTWESMAVLLLPIGIILAVGLITQLEYKNNAWKQLHTTPQSMATIYFAKLAVILVMMVQLFILFNIGMYLSAVIPSFLFTGVPLPAAPIPWEKFFIGNAKFYINCLPILGLQYLLSLRFKNFLVPMGVGFLVWVLGIATLSWEYNWIFPYIYGGLEHLFAGGNKVGSKPPVAVIWLALGYFMVFLTAGYFLYVTNEEKG